MNVKRNWKSHREKYNFKTIREKKNHQKLQKSIHYVHDSYKLSFEKIKCQPAKNQISASTNFFKWPI